jgi:hypothetical protein
MQMDNQMNKETKNYFEKRGVMVRIPREVEAIFSELHGWQGYHKCAIRNTALLYGLMVIAITGHIPKDDKEYQRLLDGAKRLLKERLGV